MAEQAPGADRLKTAAQAQRYASFWRIYYEGDIRKYC